MNIRLIEENILRNVKAILYFYIFCVILIIDFLKKSKDIKLIQNNIFEELCKVPKLKRKKKHKYPNKIFSLEQK